MDEFPYVPFRCTNFYIIINCDLPRSLAMFNEHNDGGLIDLFCSSVINLKALV